MSKIILLCVFSHTARTAVGLCTPASPQTHEECVLLQGSRGCNATRPQEFLSSLIISQKNCCMCNLLLFVSVAAWLAPFPPSLRSLSFCVWARRAFLSHSASPPAHLSITKQPRASSRQDGAQQANTVVLVLGAFHNLAETTKG